MHYRCTIVPIIGAVISETIEAESIDEARAIYSRTRNIDEDFIRVEPYSEASDESSSIQPTQQT